MYAAPFGFMKDMGDGIVVVAIRSALIMIMYCMPMQDVVL